MHQTVWEAFASREIFAVKKATADCLTYSLGRFKSFCWIVPRAVAFIKKTLLVHFCGDHKRCPKVVFTRLHMPRNKITI
jgi:hypothetical protein